ncbi:S8 family peptidase [Roseivirga sp. E12]|uniref:S8 family peptidase n=1 Tax=Roseivirga sp. E12 TaxID=2819237 RepID=UPI001ABD399F|nr:S8 family peptidase [Roseivirga sp. E12]MBO3699780.1 S8 family peptidase [Roseivirga sp. E12]
MILRNMKKVFSLALLCLAMSLSAQNATPPKNWFNLDPVENRVNGVSTEKAYEYLKGKESKTVIVAVIDSGIDILHEDLKDVVWINEGEIPDNGIDDDNNGYVDDVYGWNFIGGKDGTNVDKDSYALAREYKRLQPIYEGKTKDDFKKKELEGFEYWEEVKTEFEKGANESAGQMQLLQSIDTQLRRFNKLFQAYFMIDTITYDIVQKVNSTDQTVLQGKAILSSVYEATDKALPLDSLIYFLGLDLEQVTSQSGAYDLDFDPRGIVGDDPNQLGEVGYGNNDVIGIGTKNFHGTHVSGIIAAKRGNGIGIDGVANNVKIMALRAVPDGDERDKDVANAIRYAVDNGAQVINMSFGKSYSAHLDYVYEAIEYAESKGVLLVHAAGNSSKNIDEANNFPNDYIGKRKNMSNWIEVGASDSGLDENYVGVFSNYGKKNVDVFAPGVAIYSLAPDNDYQDAQGTSMASPVTAGVAAMLLSYFPDLKAEQVKDILIRSSRSLDGLRVPTPGSGEEVKFSDLSVSGGIINAAEAVKLAESMTLKKKR